MESEVDRLKHQLESTSKEVESAARDVGRPLPDDWDAPIHIATKRTIRQVEVYCTSMQAEVEHLTASLETSSKMERIATMRATGGDAIELSSSLLLVSSCHPSSPLLSPGRVLESRCGGQP